VADRILLFTADVLRGKIIKKVLNRNGLECGVYNHMLAAGDIIAKHAPAVVIFDTQGCFQEEINHLRSICQTLKHTNTMVLGEDCVIDRFKGPRIRKTLCLPDPLDPVLIATKAKEILLRKKKLFAGNDSLEKTLKSLLNIK